MMQIHLFFTHVLSLWQLGLFQKYICDGRNCDQCLIYACCKNNTTGGERIKKSVEEKRS